MKKKHSTGIAFSMGNSNKSINKKSKPASYLLGSIGLVLVYLGTTQLAGLEASIIVAIATIATAFLNNITGNKPYVFWICTAVIVVSSIAFICANVSVIGETAKGFLNAIYAESEARQSYIYLKNDVSQQFDVASNATKLFLPVCVLMMQLICIGLNYGKKIGMILLLTFCIAAEIYYGICPSALLNVFMFIVLLVGILVDFGSYKADLQAWAIVIFCGIVICLVANTMYPAQLHQRNEKVYAVNETIRDYFDVGEQRISSAIRPNFIPEEIAIEYDKAQQSEGEKASKEKGDNNGLGGSKKHAANAKTVSVNIVTVIALVTLIVAILLWILIVLIAGIRRKKAIYNGDVYKSITYCFDSSLRLLSHYGLTLSECSVPMDYSKKIEKLTSEKYADAYRKVIGIRQDMIYGGKETSLDMRNQVIDFYMATRRYVIKKSKLINKFKIVLIKLL